MVINLRWNEQTSCKLCQRVNQSTSLRTLASLHLPKLGLPVLCDDRFIVYPGKRDNTSLIHRGLLGEFSFLFFSLINSQKEFTWAFFRFENAFTCKTQFFQFKPYFYLGKVFSCNHSSLILWFLNTSLHHNRRRKQMQQLLLLVSR